MDSVRAWLSALGLGQYAEAFERNDVDARGGDAADGVGRQGMSARADHGFLTTTRCAVREITSIGSASASACW